IELRIVSRRGQRGMANVVLDVEIPVVNPDRAALPERNGGDTLAITRHELQARLYQRHDVLIGRRRALEHRQPPDVHVRRAVRLEVEERRVDATEPLEPGHERHYPL